MPFADDASGCSLDSTELCSKQFREGSERAKSKR